MRSIDLIACHLVGEFALQGHVMTRTKLTDPYARAGHATGYHIPFLLCGLVTGVNRKRLAAFLVLSWLCHFVTDSRRWIQNDEWPPGAILNDQAIHLATLAILNRVAGRSRI